MSNHSHPIFGGRELHFVFFRRPVEFLPSDDGSGRVGGIRFEKTHLKGQDHSIISSQFSIVSIQNLS